MPIFKSREIENKCYLYFTKMNKIISGTKQLQNRIIGSKYIMEN